MRLDSFFMFLIQQDSVGCILSGVRLRKGGDCDVGTCSSVEDDDVPVALTHCRSRVDKSCMWLDNGSSGAEGGEMGICA
jgi:hypothetical protein